MTRAELEHAIRAACDLTNEHELIVFGSQAILGEFPDAPQELRQSAEVDVAPLPTTPNAGHIVNRIDGNLGEFSPFHLQHGFYVHGAPIEAATFPPGWRARARKVQNTNTRDHIGWCVEAHDLAVSKLVAFRDKDRDFVRVMLAERMVKPRTLIARIRRLRGNAERVTRLATWVDTTVRDLNRGTRA